MFFVTQLYLPLHTSTSCSSLSHGLNDFHIPVIDVRLQTLVGGQCHTNKLFNSKTCRCRCSDSVLICCVFVIQDGCNMQRKHMLESSGYLSLDILYCMSWCLLGHHIADPQEISFPSVITLDSLPYHPLSWIWTHRFECALNAVATIELKLILLSFNREVMLACGPQCHGLLDRSLDDICCIRSEVIDLRPCFPIAKMLNAAVWISTSGWGPCLHVSLLYINMNLVRGGSGMEDLENVHCSILMFFTVTYNFGLSPSFWLVSVTFLILVLSC